MIADQEIARELAFNTRWLTDEYKNSNYYRGYLSKTFDQLIQSTYETTS